MTFHTTFDTTADSLALPSQSQLPERRTSPLASGRSSQAKEVCNKHTFGIGIRGGGGGTRWASATLNFSNGHFWAKQQVIFAQNHLIFGQALEKIFGHETSERSWSHTPVIFCYAIWFVGKTMHSHIHKGPVAQNF